MLPSTDPPKPRLTRDDRSQNHLQKERTPTQPPTQPPTCNISSHGVTGPTTGSCLPGTKQCGQIKHLLERHPVCPQGRDDERLTPMRPQALARPSTREAHTTTHMRTSKSNIASRLDAQTHSQSDPAVCSPRQHYSGLKARLDLLLRLWQDTKEPRAVRQIAPVSLALQHGQATGHGPQGRHGRRAYRSDRARFGPDVPHPRRLLVPHHGDGQVGRLSDLLYRRRTRARRNTENRRKAVGEQQGMTI